MSPVLLTISGYEIRWYSILLVFAVIVGILLFQREGKKFKVKPEFVFNMAFWAIIFGLIGARLYYVIFNWDYFGNNLNEIYQIWEGGLAIHGGIIAGFLTVLVYCKKYKVRVIRYLDFIAVPLLLAQAIGRWGNFFNSEAHGRPTDLPWGIMVHGVKVQPTFLYESIWCLALFFFLLWVDNRRKFKGQTMCLYGMLYSVERFFVEGLRTDSLMIGPFRQAQVISVTAFIICFVLYKVWRKKYAGIGLVMKPGSRERK